MPNDNKKIKVAEGAIALGFTPSEAFQRALGITVTEFARRHELHQPEVSMCWNRYAGRIYAHIRDLTAEAVGAPREWVDRIIDSHAPPMEQAEGADTDTPEPAEDAA